MYVSDDEILTETFQKKRNADSSNRDEKSVHRTSTDIENSGKLKIADNGNNRPTDIECRRSSTAEVTDVDKRNGNESVTTTDTNSDSLIVASSDTPPDTTNSSPNTRTCSPSHAGLNTNATNVNGMLKKNALKAALSLDPSALCRGTIPYEKIAFSPPPQRSSTPGSMEIEKVTFYNFSFNLLTFSYRISFVVQSVIHSSLAALVPTFLIAVSGALPPPLHSLLISLLQASGGGSASDQEVEVRGLASRQLARSDSTRLF